KKLLYKRHHNTVTVSMSRSHNNPACQLIYTLPSFGAPDCEVMPKIYFSPNVLGNRCIEYFDLFTIFYISTRKPTNYIAREINIAIEVKVMLLIVRSCLCINIEIIVGANDKLLFDASC